MNAIEQNSKRKESTMNHQYYDVHEASRILGLSTNKVRYEALKGRLKHARVNGRGPHRRMIFKAKWLLKYLQRNGHPIASQDHKSNPKIHEGTNTPIQRITEKEVNNGKPR